ncbi:proline-rich protein 36-like [Actinia tenebrosa]|uniref:Proline-rich protein 36-like n=1 Tax=Actinia tenebrosa TaxID=6105 RepID=A0A6P8J424_ACTTE|nr:proline-rich protein 36-like [Actinia tenebrosa]
MKSKFFLLVCLVTELVVFAVAKSKHGAKHKDHHKTKEHHHSSKSSKRQFIPVAPSMLDNLPGNSNCMTSCQKLCTPDCDFACCVPHPHPAPLPPSQPSNCASYCPKSCYPNCSPACCGLSNQPPNPQYAPVPPPRVLYSRPSSLPVSRRCSRPGCPKWCFPTCSYSCCNPRPQPLYHATTTQILPPFRRPDTRFYANRPALAPLGQKQFNSFMPRNSARLMPLQNRGFIGPYCGRFCSKRCYPSCSPSCCSALSPPQVQSFAPAPIYQPAFSMPYQAPPQQSLVLPPPACPAACPATCYPQCNPGCCFQRVTPPPPPPPIPAAPTCPAPCVNSQACYPKCTPNCCLTQVPPLPVAQPQVFPYNGPKPLNPGAVTPGMPQAFHPIIGPPVPNSPQLQPMVGPPNSPNPQCPPPCSPSCFPQCTTSCCSASPVPFKPPEVIVLIPRPPPVCPAPCSSACYPKCEKSCCCGANNVNGLLPLEGGYTGMCASD